MSPPRESTTVHSSSSTDEPARMLVIDDDSQVVALAGTYLDRLDADLTVRTETDPREALASFGAGDADCVVSDYDMPGMDGLSFLAAVRERDPDVPLVLFTRVKDERVVERAREQGVTYVQKFDGGTSA